MKLTYILVDFENGRPSADEIAELQGDRFRVWIFRGPHQKQYEAELSEALQPLGGNVKFVRCAKPGRNALDMHIAFHMGVLVDEHRRRDGSGPKSARFIVVSKDADFDPLLQHVGSFGYLAAKTASVREALSLTSSDVLSDRAETGVGNDQVVGANVPTVYSRDKETLASGKAVVMREAPSAISSRVNTQATKTAPKGSTLPLQVTTVKKPLQKVMENLLKHEQGRPKRSREKLENHVRTVLGGTASIDAARDLVEQLERMGVVTITDEIIEYKNTRQQK